MMTVLLSTIRGQCYHIQNQEQEEHGEHLVYNNRPVRKSSDI